MNLQMSSTQNQPATSDATVPGVGSLLQNTVYGKDQVKGVVDNYVDFFDKSKGACRSPCAVQGLRSTGFTEEERKEHYETVVNSYYDLGMLAPVG